MEVININHAYLIEMEQELEAAGQRVRTWHDAFLKRHCLNTDKWQEIKAGLSAVPSPVILNGVLYYVDIETLDDEDGWVDQVGLTKTKVRDFARPNGVLKARQPGKINLDYINNFADLDSVGFWWADEPVKPYDVTAEYVVFDRDRKIGRLARLWRSGQEDATAAVDIHFSYDREGRLDSWEGDIFMGNDTDLGMVGRVRNGVLVEPALDITDSIVPINARFLNPTYHLRRFLTYYSERGPFLD